MRKIHGRRIRNLVLTLASAIVHDTSRGRGPRTVLRQPRYHQKGHSCVIKTPWGQRRRRLKSGRLAWQQALAIYDELNHDAPHESAPCSTAG
jgi:hypothetical protein